MRLSLFVRNKIPGYNNGNQYSIKKVINERNSYFESYNEKTDDVYLATTKKILTKMDLIYRLRHSTEKKYIDLYLALRKQLINLDFFNEKDSKQSVGDRTSKINEQQLQSDIKEIYDLYHSLNTESDNLEIDFKNNLKKMFPTKDLDLKPQKIYDLFSILESIDEQKTEIYKTPLQDNESTYTEFGAQEESPQRFTSLINPIKKTFDDEPPSSDEDEKEEAPKSKETIQTNKSTPKPEMDYITEIQTVKNHFKEFYLKHKTIIFAREFWKPFLFDILSELRSERSDEQLLNLFESAQYFNSIEPAFDLVQNRQSILSYSKSISKDFDFTDSKKKSKDVSTSKPTNFAVKSNKKSGFDEYSSMYSEDLPIDPEILSLLVKLNINTYFNS